MKTQVVATLALAAGCAQAFVAPRVGLNKPAVVQARYVVWLSFGIGRSIEWDWVLIHEVVG